MGYKLSSFRLLYIRHNPHSHSISHVIFRLPSYEWAASQTFLTPVWCLWVPHNLMDTCVTIFHMNQAPVLKAQWLFCCGNLYLWHHSTKHKMAVSRVNRRNWEVLANLISTLEEEYTLAHALLFIKPYNLSVTCHTNIRTTSESTYGDWKFDSSDH